MKSPTITILVPNYKGYEKLLQNLPGVMEGFKRDGLSFKLIIVDDGSGKDEHKNISSSFPQAQLIANETRKGYVCSIIAGMKHCKTHLVFLLNNDMIFETQSSIRPMIETAMTESVFSVTPKVKNLKKQNKDEGYSLNIINHGLIGQNIPGLNGSMPVPSTLSNHSFMHGGCSFVNRNYYKILGGVSPIFTPGYWEDVDISIRAQALGLKVLYQPQTVFIHQHSQTMGIIYRTWQKEYLSKRNWFLLNYKHLHNGQLIKGLLQNIYIVFRQRDIIRALSLLAATIKILK